MPSLEEGSQGAVFICQAVLVEAAAGLPAAHVLGTCLHRDIACRGHMSAQGHCMLSLASSQGALGLPEEFWAPVFSSALAFINQV